MGYMASGVYKYHLSQQSSFDQTEGTNEHVPTNGNVDNIYENEDRLHKDPVLEEQKFESSNDMVCVGNASLQELKKKVLPKLMDLGNVISKKIKCLTELQNQLIVTLTEIKYKQTEVIQFIELNENKSIELCSSRSYFRKFGAPYFSDQRGFNAPYNEDHYQKQKNGELEIQSLPKTYNWTKTHKHMMQTAIKNCLVSEQSTLLTKEIAELKKDLRETSKRKKESKSLVKGIVKKITEKQEKLKGLYKMPLKELIAGENENRDYDWMKFSSSLFDGQHSSEECKVFWNLYLKPAINKDCWSDQEDKKLIELAAQHQYQDWDKIAELLGTNRTGYQCIVHYKARLEGSNNLSSGKWTKKEDKKLLTVINSSKLGNYIPWGKVSSFMGNRNHDQVYTRWSHTLNPDIVKGKFSKEEDLLVVSGIEVFGATFKQLALFLKHRTSTQIRERYERYLLPKTTKTGTWSLEEDEKLLKLLNDCGSHNWSKIAKEMKTRTRTQVRLRYNFIQRMMEKHPGWTIADVNRNKKQKKIKNNTKKDVKKIKDLVNKIENVFPLSDLEKETYLLDKLSELKQKIFSKVPKKVSKKREFAFDIKSGINNDIVELFSVCHIRSPRKSSKSYVAQLETNSLNELFLLNKYFGLQFELPIIESDIWDNPRLTFALKCRLTNALNNDSNELISSCSMSQATAVRLESTNGIDCPVSSHDNTLIMLEWWYDPPIDITRLNFSEFFKRTVFDYSYGMHLDIWQSKMKRSWQILNAQEYVVNIEETLPTPDYLFPPNQATALGIRSVHISEPILERHLIDKDIAEKSHFIKKEKNEDWIGNDNLEGFTEALGQVCGKYQKLLLKLFTWPHILSINSMSKGPSKDHSSRKRLEDLRGDIFGDYETDLAINNTFQESEQTPLMPSNSHLSLDKKHKLKDAKQAKIKAEPERKKAKLIDSSKVLANEENYKSNKGLRQPCEKMNGQKHNEESFKSNNGLKQPCKNRNGKKQTSKENSNFHENELCNVEMSLALPRQTYKRINSTKSKK
ncbi:uncharacterized protein LOC129005283 [Macrosteles quadrilineatus]|uniref:uncharacterized protein LOC129005283 n=1 Tax=Macrosteles quadrilineatus TaxID=74068 RepID=UPI0023E1BDA0|nr:uncharacterized protein LOC129005283 [Macrosteles quadrilineatus]